MMPIADHSNSRGKNIFSFLLLILLHIALLLGLNLAWEEKQAEKQKAWEKWQREEIRTIMAESHPKVFLQRAFFRLYEQLAGIGISAQTISKLPNPMLHPLGVTICCFDEKGSPIEPNWGKIPGKFVFRRFWSFLTATGENPTKDKMFQGILGRSYLPERARAGEGVLHSFTENGKDGMLIWKRINKSNGLLLHVSDLPTPFSTASHYVRTSSAATGTILVAPREQRFFSSDRNLPSWREVFPLGLRQPSSRFQHGGFFHVMEQHPAGFWLIRSAPASDVVLDSAWSVGVTLIPLVSLILWIILIRYGVLERLKLLPQLTVFLGTSFLLPALWLILLDILSFQLQTQKIVETAQQENLSRLINVDMRYVSEREQFSREFIALSRLPIIRNNDQAEIGALFQPKKDEDNIELLQTHADNGSVLFSNSGNQMYRQWIEMLAGKILRSIPGNTIPAPATPLERMIHDIINSPLLGLGWILDHPFVPNPFQMGPLSFTLCWRSFPASDTRRVAFVCMSRMNQYLQANFFRKTLTESTWAFDSRNHEWYPAPPSDRRLQSLALQAILSQRPAHVSDLDDSQAMLSAYPSLQIPEFALVTIGSMKTPLAQAWREKAILAGILLIITILGCSLGIRVYHSFLLPIKELSHGIEVMAQGKFHHRLPELGRDELGRLGVAMNRLGTEMTEIGKARLVQQGHRPTARPRIGEYQIAVHASTASDLGGDYCDLIGIPGGGTFFILGDVTGHGISAAIIAAMMKTVCSSVFQEQNSLECVMAKMNKVLTQAVKRKKHMTAVLGILAPDSNIIEWCCAGHPYPLLRQADGQIRFLEIPQPPLGFRPGYRWKTQQVPLNPGDSLILYSDGIIEATDLNGTRYGLNRLKDLAVRFGGLSPEEILSLLLTDLHVFTGVSGADDDITICVISRQEVATSQNP